MMDILIDNEFYDEVEKSFNDTDLDASYVIEEMAKAYYWDIIVHPNKNIAFVEYLKNKSRNL